MSKYRCTKCGKVFDDQKDWNDSWRHMETHKGHDEFRKVEGRLKA